MDTGTLAGVLVIGAVVGFLGGMFGKGGSAIATPLLHLIGISAIPLSAVGARVAIRTESTRLERVYGAGLLVLGLVTLATSLS